MSEKASCSIRNLVQKEQRFDVTDQLQHQPVLDICRRNKSIKVNCFIHSQGSRFLFRCNIWDHYHGILGLGTSSFIARTKKNSSFHIKNKSLHPFLQSYDVHRNATSHFRPSPSPSILFVILFLSNKNKQVPCVV